MPVATLIQLFPIKLSPGFDFLSVIKRLKAIDALTTIISICKLLNLFSFL